MVSGPELEDVDVTNVENDEGSKEKLLEANEMLTEEFPAIKLLAGAVAVNVTKVDGTELVLVVVTCNVERTVVVS